MLANSTSENGQKPLNGPFDIGWILHELVDDKTMFQKYINTHTDRTWFALFAATTFSHLLDIYISSIIFFLISSSQPTARGHW